MNDVVLRFDSVSYRYPRRREDALSDVTFLVHAHQPTFLVGENGAGKTTLIRLALGHLEVSDGSVHRQAPKESGRPLVGYCPQTFDLPGHCTVRQYLTYLSWLKGLPRGIVTAEVETAVERVALTDVVDRRLGELSGGMARRVGLAQSLLGSPPLLLWDEPTAGLDPATRVEIRATIARVTADSTAIISTHLADDITHTVPNPAILALVEGRLTFSGRLKDVSGPVTPSEHMSSAEAAVLSILRSSR